MSSSSFAALASKPAAEKEKASVPETPPLHSVQIDGSVITKSRSTRGFATSRSDWTIARFGRWVDVRGDEFVSVSVAIVFGE